MRRYLLLAVLLIALWLSSCVKVKHEMTIQPVYVTVEIRVKIDRELEDFFGDIDQAGQKSKSGSEEAARDKEKKDEKK
jgi:hypothetical protein